MSFTRKGVATATATVTGSTGYFQFGIADPVTVNQAASDYTGGTITYTRDTAFFTGGTFYAVSPSKSTVYTISGSATRVSYYSTASGIKSGSTITAPTNIRGMFALNDTSTWWVTNDGSNNLIWHYHELGTSTVTAKYTGAVAYSSTHHYEWFGFSGNVVWELDSQTGQVVLSKYSIDGSNNVTVTARYTGSTNKAVKNFRWLEDGYGAGPDFAYAGTSSVVGRFYIFSGGNFTEVTTVPTNISDNAFDWGHTLVVPLTYNKFIVALVDSSGSNYWARFAMYSGGTWGNATTSAWAITSDLSPPNPWLQGVDTEWYDSSGGYLWITNFSKGLMNNWIRLNVGNLNIAIDSSGTGPSGMDGINTDAAYPVRHNGKPYWIIRDPTTSFTYITSIANWDDYTPGQYVRAYYKHHRGTTLANIGQPTGVELYLYDDNSSDLVWSQNFVPANALQTETGFNLWLTSDGTSGGTPLHGTYRFRVRALLNGIGAYTADSDGAQTDDVKGFIRVGTYATGFTVKSDAAETTTKNPYAFPDTTYFKLRTTHAAKTNTSANKTFNIKPLSGSTVLKTVASSTGNALYSGSAAVDNDYPAGLLSTNIRVTIDSNSSGLTSEKWVHFLAPTGSSDLTFVDKFTMEKSAAFNVDKRIYYATTGSPTVSTADMKVKTYHPTGTTFTTLYHREESVTGYTYLLNARDELITTAAPMTGTIIDSGGTTHGTMVYSHSGTGVYTGSFTIPLGTTGQRVAEHVGTGQPFLVRFQPAGTNTPIATGVTSWNTTTWYKVDSHPQSGKTLNTDLMTNNALNEQTSYIISADEMYWWGHVQNARGEEMSGVQIIFTTVAPNNVFTDRGTRVTRSDGWNSSGADSTSGYVNMVPQAPAGIWRAQVFARKSGSAATVDDPWVSPNWGFSYETTTGGQFSSNGPSGADAQYVNFVSAFRDNITIEPSWGTYQVPGMAPNTGTQILVGFRAHKDGSGKAVDTGTTPRIKIARFKQSDGSVEFVVGTEALGEPMTRVSTVFPGTGDPYAWIYTWSTTGLTHGTYVAQFNAQIDGAITYEHLTMPITSGFTWVTDFAAHTGATVAHGAQGAVVGTTNTQTLTNKTLTTPIIADFTNAQHDHKNAVGGGAIEQTPHFNPLDFSMFGIFKTYLNPGDQIKSYTHNQIQGLAAHDVAFAYSGNYITGMTIDNDSTTNSVAVTWSETGVTSGKPTQVVETINHKLSGTAKTVTTVISYNGTGKATGTTTTVS